MRKWRSESALDAYNGFAATVLFASPWLFGLTNETAELDFWICGAAIVDVGLVDACLRELGRVDEPRAGSVAHRFTLGPWVRPSPRDAFQCSYRRRGDFHGPA